MIVGYHVHENSQKHPPPTSINGQLRQRPFASPGPEHESFSWGAQYGHSLAEMDLVPRLLIQPKLALAPPEDKCEQEADRMAQRIAGEDFPLNYDPVVRWCDKCAKRPEEDNPLRRKPPEACLSPNIGIANIDPDLASSIQQSKSKGQTLSDGVRQPMEQAFGTDFSAVRIHSDNHADSLNRSLQARAFTTGQDMFFRNGAYQPASYEGRKLLAHELTHVVQQSRNMGMIQRSIEQPVAPIANSAIANKAVERSGGAIGPAYNYSPGWWYSPNTDLAGWKPRPSPQEERQGAQNPPPAGEGIVNWGVVPTCNLFVYDVLYAAGLNPPLQSNRHYYSASQTYNRSGPLRSYFGLVRDPSAVQPGDVMANGVHLEIVISSIRRNRFDAIGAHGDGARQTAKTYDNSLRFLRRVFLGDFNIPSREESLA